MMLPARADGPPGTTFRGKAVSLTVLASPPSGQPDRQVDVNTEQWDDCLTCREFDSCYMLCSARLALQSGGLISQQLVRDGGRASPKPPDAAEPEPVSRRHKGQTQSDRRLTEDLILQWADDYFARSGMWPRAKSGPVEAEPTTTWAQISMALRMGHRGLQGGSSLPQLLRVKRGMRNKHDLPPLSYDQIYRWIDAHFEQQQRCPDWSSQEVIPGSQGDSWYSIDYALREGTRGLRGGESVRVLVREYAARRPGVATGPLSNEQILSWAEAHFKKHKRWPSRYAGAVVAAPGENWLAIDAALKRGLRGLEGGTSLKHLIRTTNGELRSRGPSRLTEAQVFGWCEAYRTRHGSWPTHRSGRIPEAPGMTFRAADAALRKGRYGLPGGWSLEKICLNGPQSSA
jgi:hypothetical protein